MPSPLRNAAALSLEQLTHLCQIGRVDTLSKPAVQATGWTSLDSSLPGGGLPIGAVTEIMSPLDGIGELRIVISALAQLTRNDRYVAFVNPPYLPYPLALMQQGLKLERLIMIRVPTTALSLWSSEQMLRCSAFGAVLVWPDNVNDKELRRLQLAAEAGGNLAILYRSLSAARQSSPAAVRLMLHASLEGAHVEIKKCRGGRAGAIVRDVFEAA